MTWLAKQSYYKVIRTVFYTELRTEVDERVMYLYPDKIKTKHREFAMKDVFDMSYRQMGGGEGMLYLHTNQGVFSYNLRNHPAEILEAFTAHKKGK